MDLNFNTIVLFWKALFIYNMPNFYILFINNMCSTVYLKEDIKWP